MPSLSTRRLAILKSLAKRGDYVAQAADEGLGIENTAGQLTFLRFTDVAAAGSTGIGASLAGNSTNNSMTISAQPTYARMIRAAFAASWDGGNIVLVGTDQDGAPLTETLTSNPNNTRDSTKAFKTLISATKTAVGATANAVTLGNGPSLGFGVKGVVTNSAILISNGVAEAFGSIDYTNRLWTPTTGFNGTNDYNIILASNV